MRELKWAFFGALKAVAAFLLVAIPLFNIGMYMVRDSHDGQAGMGPFFGSIYAGIVAAAVTFVVSVGRDYRRAKGR